MLGINVTIDGERVVIEGLENLSDNIKSKAIPRGIRRIVKGTASIALEKFLSGPVRGLKSKTSKGGRQRAVAGKPELAGGYPVPRLSGTLKRLLGWLFPGQSKSSNGLSYNAGPMEGLVYDSALHAGIIHEGTGSSKKYGPRRFLDDAFSAFNRGARTTLIMEDEIEKEITASGLG